MGPEALWPQTAGRIGGNRQRSGARGCWGGLEGHFSSLLEVAMS